MNRTKNASRNMFFGVILKMVTLLVPFILRTILIRTLGIEYIGLGSLFTSILQVLNLAELGISSAIVYSMYGAIASKKDEEICQLMNLYKKIYRVIGLVVLALGFLILPFLRFFISGDVPADTNIYILYSVYLINTCLTYFLFAYKSCLFTAHQRNDVISKVSIFVSLLTYILQGLFLILFKNYFFYVIVLPVTTIVNNLVISYACSKQYPQYVARGLVSEQIKKDIKQKVLSLFIYKIGGIVLISVDTIVISAFLGLNVLGKYNNYYYIITSLFGFFEVYYSSITAGVGNSIKLESKKKNKMDFDRLFVLQGFIVSWSTTCLFCLYQPFMRIWVGENLMFPLSLVINLTILFFVWKIMDVINIYKNAAGLWNHDKWRPLVASILNLSLNLVLVNIIGIYGIVVSTIISIVVVIFPWSSFVLFKYYFNEGNYKKSFVIYVVKVFVFLLITIVSSLVTFFITKIIPEASIWYLLLRALVCSLVPLMFLICVMPFFKEYDDTKGWLTIRVKSLVNRNEKNSI